MTSIVLARVQSSLPQLPLVSSPALWDGKTNIKTDTVQKEIWLEIHSEKLYRDTKGCSLRILSPVGTQSGRLGIRRVYSLQSGMIPPQRGLPGMILNCIWWWGFRDLGSVECPFIAITLISSLTRVVVLVRVPWMSRIDLFTNHSYSIRPCAKKTSKDTTTRKSI